MILIVGTLQIDTASSHWCALNRIMNIVDFRHR